MTTKEPKPPFSLVVFEMKKPFGIAFASRPTKDQVFETIKDLITSGKLDKHFDIQIFDISEDIHGTIAERT